MTTKTEMVKLLKSEFPTLRTGSDETGYTEMGAAEYELQIGLWADNRLAQEAEILAIKEAETQKAAILAKIGITADELRIALS
jgi:hypothetical protein